MKKQSVIHRKYNKEIFDLYFIQNLTQVEIAKRYNAHPRNVCDLILRIINKFSVMPQLQVIEHVPSTISDITEEELLNPKYLSFTYSDVKHEAPLKERKREDWRPIMLPKIKNKKEAEAMRRERNLRKVIHNRELFNNYVNKLNRDI